VLPLPADVGEALADYVRHGRPRCTARALFVTLHAPFTALAPKGTVFAVVRRACRRAGATPFGPHRLRHALACDLHAGVDVTVIALWLGHESPASTRPYLHADMAMKERALARTMPPDTPPGRYTAPDTLLAFLDSL
jgi:integrase